MIYRPSRGMQRKKYAERTSPPVATVLHTTGMGPHRRMQQRPGKFATPFEAALWIYQNVMDAGPHYVVGQHGEVAQLAEEHVCAWHVGGRKSRAYARHNWDHPWRSQRYAWWKKKWQGMQGPRELAGGHLWDPYVAAPKTLKNRVIASWAKGSCNANTFGIEIIPPKDNGPWSPEAWSTLIDLIKHLNKIHGIPLEEVCLVSHSDAHPLSRTRPRGTPWDPSNSQWSWDLFQQHLGQ